jgi:predicted ATPase with chaperone activity
VTPIAPLHPAETGLPFLFLAELACKLLFVAGPQRAPELAARIKLPEPVLEPVIAFLRREQLCQVAGGSSGSNLMFALTLAGRERAEQALRQSQYAGAAPVPLKDYVAQVRRQALAGLTVTRADMQRAFEGVLVSGAVLEQLGAAMNSGRALFVYGPAGSGKTYVTEHLAGLMSGEVYVPHALFVGNQVIQVFDPNVHKPAGNPGAARGSTEALPHARSAADPRWVLCQRPVVIAGGELTLAMLDLQFDHGSRFYSAPPQVKANNGLFIVDDLGRQLLRPRDLMNRWIVPLDRRVDYLALHTGEKFRVPFDVTVVFSSNLEPAQLADETFLRRLGYKIHLGAVDADLYRQLCQQVAGGLGMPCGAAAVDYIIGRLNAEGRPLLACTPRDLLCQVRDRARFCGVAAEPTEQLLSWAFQNYFAHDAVLPANAGNHTSQTRHSMEVAP